MNGCSILAALLLASLAPAFAQTTWHVDANATPPGNGTLGSPYVSIQFALSQSSTVAGDTVLVAPGTYFEAVDFLGKDVAVRSSGGSAATVIHGGFAPDVTCVSFVNGEGPAVVLEGFTLRNGSGPFDPVLSANIGGGIRVDLSSPTIVDCLIADCRADRGACISTHLSNVVIEGCTLERGNVPVVGGTSFGGGLHVVGGQVIFRSSTIRACYASYDGGGVWIGGGASVLLRDATVEENSVIGRGGGIACEGSTLSCIGVVVRGNSSSDAEGGGLWVFGGNAAFADSEFRSNQVFNDHMGGAIELENATLSMSDSTLRGNASARGAGIAALGSSVTLERTRLIRNTAQALQALDGSGGGLWLDSASGASLLGCVLVENYAFPRANGFGGEGAATFGACSLERCTVYRNFALGGEALQGASVTTSIVYSNSAGTSTSSFTYCDVSGGPPPGPGNFSAWPRFWNAGALDFHLVLGSPCIDTGDPALPPDGDGSRADVGAFEFDPNWCAAPNTYCTPKTNSLGCVPELDVTGRASLSGASQALVVASQVRNQKLGHVIWSLASNDSPFGGGTLCVAQPVRRTPVQSSGGSASGDDCTGTYSYTFDASFLAANAMLLGGTFHIQAWSRDPGFAPPNAIGLTGGLRLFVCP